MNNCRCPMCRRFPRTMRKISELESKPLTEESRTLLQSIVANAYAKMAERIAVKSGSAQ